MAKKTWMFTPDAGGCKIPKHLQPSIEQRVQKHAAKKFRGKYTRLEIRFRGQFCYIDAYTEPSVPPGWPPKGWHETRKQHIERLRNTPTHLCRLRYFGDMERWGFAFFGYSNESYQLSMFPDGDFFGTPEAALEAAGFAYLS